VSSARAPISRCIVVAALAAALLVVPAARALGSSESPGSETENPINDQGSSYDYRSYITSVIPHVSGLSLEVLEFADRLVLRNHTGKTVTVYGYEGEPYARVLAGGRVELNTRSPAYYLNQNFYGDVTVPASASPTASPRWTYLDGTGELEWHDHRIHWMSPVVPPEVKDKGKRTKIFDWQVPIEVGTQKVAIDGELFWTPENSKAPTGAIAALAVITVLAGVFVFYMRRRRAGGPPADGSGPDIGRRPGAVTEAW